MTLKLLSTYILGGYQYHIAANSDLKPNDHPKVKMYLSSDGSAGEGDEPEAPVSPVTRPVRFVLQWEHGRLDLPEPLEVGAHVPLRRLEADSADKDFLVRISPPRTRSGMKSTNIIFLVVVLSVVLLIYLGAPFSGFRGFFDQEVLD